MSIKHPVIAVTGSSGAGTTSVTRAFQHIFRRENIIAEIIQGDFSDPDMPERLIAALGGKIDLVLSDMAPNTTGHAATDHRRIMAWAERAEAFAIEVLAQGGTFVAKVFQGGSERQMLDSLKRHFASVKHAKPPASRKGSSELYVIATGFRGA